MAFRAFAFLAFLPDAGQARRTNDILSRIRGQHGHDVADWGGCFLAVGSTLGTG